MQKRHFLGLLLGITPFNHANFYAKSNSIGNTKGNSNPLFEAFLVGTTAATMGDHKTQKKPQTGAFKRSLNTYQTSLKALLN